VGVIALFFWLIPGKTNSYFQGSFHCSYSGNNLQVMTRSQTGSKNCIDLIAQLRIRKTAVVKQTFQIKSTSLYNQSARTKLIKEGKEIDTYLAQIIEGVNSLEEKINISYQKKYFEQLKSIRLKLLSKQALLAADQTNFINNGDKKLLENIIKTIGFNYQRIKLIEGILSSTTLDEMMPLLNTYESLINSQLTWKSE
jgi:hypothetical protein